MIVKLITLDSFICIMNPKLFEKHHEYCDHPTPESAFQSVNYSISSNITVIKVPFQYLISDPYQEDDQEPILLCDLLTKMGPAGANKPLQHIFIRAAFFTLNL